MVRKISVLRADSPLLPFSDWTYENMFNRNAHARTFGKNPDRQG